MSEDLQVTPSPTEAMPQDTSTSETAQMLPEALEAPREAESAVPVTIDNEHISPEKGQIQETAQTENPGPNEPVHPAPEPTTAQIPANEPIMPAPNKRGLLSMARGAIQFRKRKKLQKILDHFLHKSPLTNDDVEKLLHVSDATATRYLERLEREGKIKQAGKTGRSVSYSRII